MQHNTKQTTVGGTNSKQQKGVGNSPQKCEKNILNLIIEGVWRLCDLYTPRNLFAIRNLSRNEGGPGSEGTVCTR